MTRSKKIDVPPGQSLGQEPKNTPDPAMRPQTQFPVVGIGASAGGLAAFEAFFSAMPAATESGMAFVLVQHLAPDHESILTNLIKRYARMEVFEVEDGMPVRPNCTYIIPPNRDMAFLNGTLQLLEPAAPRGLRLPIDFFFRSLAQDRQEQAICIVLSGTGSDGTMGIRAVKGEGGMVMAQSPETTEHHGMPSSAIATGLVDYVLPPAEMPAQLIAYVSHAFGKAPHFASPPVLRAEEALIKVFILLRAHTGHDFSHYKQNTVSRRVERRMAIHQIKRLEEYVRYLQQTPAEVEGLFRDLLIGVTSFFRDPAVFETLEEQIRKLLVAGSSPGKWIRVWVPGCSTGEEAYSIAILFREQSEALKQECRVQLFATDIDRQAIEQARAGVYSKSIAADIPPERLARFFIMNPEDNAYRIQKSIRDMLVFSEQDVIKDPPFSKLDLISCRNLLIYMNGELQKKLIPLFHYALNPGGVLFLGTSETVGDNGSLFATLSRTAKLYQKKLDVSGAHLHPLERFLRPLKGGTALQDLGSASRAIKLPLRELTEQALLQQYSSAAALVDDQGNILYLHGHTGRYLELPPGEPGTNILKIAREGLRRELTTALRNASANDRPVQRDALRVKTDGGSRTISLKVQPVSAGNHEDGPARLFLVILDEAPEPEKKLPGKSSTVADGKSTKKRSGDVDSRIAALENELTAKEEYLQSTHEELETSNEELKSSNEEMQSVNEELQSTNEELETSKEELQSVNEELATVNAELQTKVSDLSRANNDMINLLAGTGIGTIFVDHQLRILRFTPTVTQVINLIQTDLGRPVGHIVANLIGYDRLAADVQEVLGSLEPKETQVRAKTGAWYLLRIRPYRTLDNVIEGAVITFTEITDMKKAQEELRESEALRRLAIIVRDASDAVTVQDLEGRIMAWNPSAEKAYGWTEAEALKMNMRDLIPLEGREEALAVLKRLGQAEILEAYHLRRITKDGRIVEVTLTATALVNASGEVYAISTTERETV